MRLPPMLNPILNRSVENDNMGHTKRRVASLFLFPRASLVRRLAELCLTVTGNPSMKNDIMLAGSASGFSQDKSANRFHPHFSFQSCRAPEDGKFTPSRPTVASYTGP